MSSYKLTQNSVRSINRTIIAVNQMRKTGIAGDLPFRQNQKRQPSGTPTSIEIGKTTAEWTKESEATIDVWKKDGAGGMVKGEGTFTAYNLFVDVEADKFVACVGGWLVAAECEGE
jgi:hypothetical protein